MASRPDNDSFTNRLPGTGGDFIDDNDVEGHRTPRLEQALPQPELDKAARQFPETDEQDVEGHRLPPRLEANLEGEGLYRGGPTTQGEVIMRGPGDNPHGER